RYASGSATIEYAVSELDRYLRMIDPSLDIVPVPSGSAIRSDGITLGLCRDLGIECAEAADPLIDDLADINIENMTGYIAGSNERSVLLGVYKFLTSMGCSWAHAAPDGEFIPCRSLEGYSYKYRKMADYPFRGQCIEGAVSFTNVRDTIRWLPKVGMNMFMLEQIVPFNYISRWYNREANTKIELSPLTFEQVSEMIPVLEREIKTCGLQLHSVGHGFMFEPYGIHYKTYRDKYELSDYARSHCAEIDGVRGLYHGSPNFTQLCYSNPEARRNVVNFVLEYAKRKPYIDFFHVWLADAANNHCECPECVKKTPSDFYVMLLNEIEETLRENNIDMRVVFILYTDTLWAPTEEKLRRSESFTLLSTLSRNYFSGPIEPLRCPVSEMPPFVRNSAKGEIPIPRKLTALDLWRKQFSGKGFLYEYYFYTAQYNDPGQIMLSKVIYKDVHRNRALGFDGIISDQTQRSFFPTGFPLYLLSRALFNEGLSYEEIAREYFTSCYGEDGMKLYDYLESITDAFRPSLLSSTDIGIVEEDTGTGKSEKRISIWQYNEDYARSLERVKGITSDFVPVVSRNLGGEYEENWKYILIHAQIINRLSDVLLHGAKGEPEEMRLLGDKLIDYLSETEGAIQPLFDLVLFNQWLKRKLR
ncbi:MAG: DUF4838 domain-containing protein, partial [Clostridiales bacterium]|nr:DUF4838 domain-containing protein [Clostridiales bacterium]